MKPTQAISKSKDYTYTLTPRSAMLNITVDILGHTVNLLEIGGRVQGVEGLLQEVIGNSAFFKGGVPAPRKGRNSRCAKQNKLKQMKEKVSIILEIFERKVEPFRSLFMLS